MKNRPNVVYINVDDLGWKDLGMMDDGYFETPHIDQFSKQAMMFTNSYASASNCAPSRGMSHDRAVFSKTWNLYRKSIGQR